MHRLSFREFPAVGSSRVSGVVVVVMHGMLGSHRNWFGVCQALSQPSAGGGGGDVATAATANVPTSPTAPATSVSALTAYRCVAFDWRNHGDSRHEEEHSLDAMADDLEAFLCDYATRNHRTRSPNGVAGDESLSISSSSSSPPSMPFGVSVATAAAAPSSSSTPPLPVVLMAHSMGGAALMHYLWRQHAQECARTNWCAGTPAPTRGCRFASNEKYCVVGCVVVDISPSERPESFEGLMNAIRFLPNLPLSRLSSLHDMERWLLDNGPRPYFTEKNLWMIKYLLSNVDTKATPHPKWKVGLEEIIRGIPTLRWPHDNTSAAGCGGACLPAMDRPPIKFVYGGASPYCTESGMNAIPSYFADFEIDVVPGGTHFLFLDKKDAFCASVRKFLRRVDSTGGSGSLLKLFASLSSR